MPVRILRLSTLGMRSLANRLLNGWFRVFWRLPRSRDERAVRSAVPGARGEKAALSAARKAVLGAVLPIGCEAGALGGGSGLLQGGNSTIALEAKAS